MTATPFPRFRSVSIPYVSLRSVGQGAEFVGWLLLAHVLSTSSLGELAVAFLLCRYAGLVADWGALGRGARDVAAQGRHGSIHLYLRIRSRLSIGLTVAGLAIALVTGHADLLPVLVVVASIGMNRDWVALGRGQGIRAGIPVAVQGIGVALGALVARTPLGGASAVAFGYGAALVVSILLNPVPVDEQKSAARPDQWLLLALIANQMTSSLDVVLLSVLVSSSTAGIYSAIYRFPNAYIALLAGVSGALLPLATHSHHGDHESHRRLVRKTMQVSSLAALVVLLSAPVMYASVPILLGPEFESGRIPLVMLTIATAVITLTSPLQTMLVARGGDRAYATIVTTGTAINVGLNLLLIPLWQMVGAASSTLAAQVFVSTCLLILLARGRLTAPREEPVAESG